MLCDRMPSKHERHYGLGMDALAIDAVEHGKTRCVVYAVFRAFEAPRMCGSSHAGHIRRGRPSVYVPAEPITTIVIIRIMIVITWAKKLWERRLT